VLNNNNNNNNNRTSSGSTNKIKNGNSRNENLCAKPWMQNMQTVLTHKNQQPTSATRTYNI
jgi:hypothetical protein